MENQPDIAFEAAPVDVSGQQPAVAPDADINSLLAEFDDAKRGDGQQSVHETPEERSPEAPAPDQRAAPPNESDLHRLALQAGQDRALIEELLINQHFTEMRRQETADYQSLLKEAHQYLKGAAVTEDYADRYLRSEYELNPEVKNAWDQRYDSAEAKARCDRTLKRTLNNMAKAVSRIPDRQATEDREAVTAAVRSASTKAPEGKAPDYGRMTDRDLSKEWGKYT